MRKRFIHFSYAGQTPIEDAPLREILLLLFTGKTFMANKALVLHALSGYPPSPLASTASRQACSPTAAAIPPCLFFSNLFLSLNLTSNCMMSSWASLRTNRSAVGVLDIPSTWALLVGPKTLVEELGVIAVVIENGSSDWSNDNLVASADVEQTLQL